MTPLALRLRNYRTFQELDLDLPAGCCAILGANGAGKSSIVNAIDLALFGPESRSWAPYLTVGGTSTELMVELEFEHAGELYRVRRGYSARGAGKSILDLEAYGPTVWEPLTLGSAKETQARLEQILGFTRRTLRASSLLLQGDGAAFTEADPAARKKILADTLGLDRYDQLRTLARRDLRACEQTIAGIDGRLQGVTVEQLDEQARELAAMIAEHDATEKNAGLDLAAAELQLSAIAVTLQAARDTETARAATVSRRDAARVARDATARLRTDAQAAEAEAALVQTALAQLPATAETTLLEQQEQQIAAQVEQHRETVRARDEALKLRELRETEKRTIEAQATAADEKARDLDAKAAHVDLGDVGKCPTCQQELGAEGKRATAQSMRAQAQAASDESAALFERAGMIVLPEVPEEPEPLMVNGELDRIRVQIRQAHEAALERSRLDERLANHRRTIDAAADPAYLAQLAAAEEALTAAEADVAALPEPVDLVPLDASVLRARAAIDNVRATLDTARREKAVAQERAAQLAARRVQLDQDLVARTEQQRLIDDLAVLDRAYGPDGIPALIVENAAIPQIETEANRILTDLGGTTSSCRVELRTDRAKADGGTRDDVLDIIVVTEQGEREYGTFSGGERTRLNLALRIALARLLATRRGAESRLLAIDEPEFLDEDGTAALADVLRGLELTGCFDRIYLVSHVPTLRDSFDVTLNVVKENGRSRIEGLVLEAVPA